MIVKAGNIAGFEVTYGDSGLFVMAVISLVTESGLVFVENVEMDASLPGSYFGFHVPPAGYEATYLIEIHAYTDDTFTTIDDNYAGSTRSYQAVIWPSFAAATTIVGTVETGTEIY